MDFAAELIGWYRKNKRNLPWRGTKDPYKIWLAEIILQQTRVDQGMSYYHAFVETWPDVHSLAKASEDRVLKTWEGLGYYSRARNLHATARKIVTDLSGKFPQNHADLLQLKGVGDYTASAISSICYGEVQPVVDGNVYRFLARYFGIKTPIDSTKGKKQFRALAEELITPKDPGTFNQAMMEFGARQCTPKNPHCGECVFRLSCVALKKKLVAKLPVKEKKTKVTERLMVYLLLTSGKYTFIRQRSEKDIWQGLYEFPLLEGKQVKLSTGKGNNVEEIRLPDKDWKKVIGSVNLRITRVDKPVKHILSHQKLTVVFMRAETKANISLKNFQRVPVAKLKDYAFPVVLKKQIELFF